MRNQRLVATISSMQHCLPDGCELVAFQPTSWYHSSRISAVSGFCLLFDHYVLHSARVANVMYVFWRCAPTSFRRLSHSHNIKAHLHTSSPCQSSICRPLCRKQSDVMSCRIIFCACKNQCGCGEITVIFGPCLLNGLQYLHSTAFAH